MRIKFTDLCSLLIKINISGKQYVIIGALTKTFSPQRNDQAQGSPERQKGGKVTQIILL